MNAIMDTGPWVALIDRSEGRHKQCVNWFEAFRGNLFSTEPVLTEVLHLLDFSVQARSAAIDFVLARAITLVPSTVSSLKRTKGLMEKYADLPMDFADATLVCTADDLSLQRIVTFDTKDFGIYRFHSREPFVLLP